MKRRYVIAAVIGGLIYLVGTVLASFYIATYDSFYRVELPLGYKVDSAKLEEPHQRWFDLSVAREVNEHGFENTMRGAAIAIGCMMLWDVVRKRLAK